MWDSIGVGPGLVRSGRRRSRRRFRRSRGWLAGRFRRPHASGAGARIEFDRVARASGALAGWAHPSGPLAGIEFRRVAGASGPLPGRTHPARSFAGIEFDGIAGSGSPARSLGRRRFRLRGARRRSLGRRAVRVPCGGVRVAPAPVGRSGPPTFRARIRGGGGVGRIRARRIGRIRSGRRIGRVGRTAHRRCVRRSRPGRVRRAVRRPRGIRRVIRRPGGVDGVVGRPRQVHHVVGVPGRAETAGRHLDNQFLDHGDRSVGNRRTDRVGIHPQDYLGLAADGAIGVTQAFRDRVPGAVQVAEGFFHGHALYQGLGLLDPFGDRIDRVVTDLAGEGRQLVGVHGGQFRDALDGVPGGLTDGGILHILADLARHARQLGSIHLRELIGALRGLHGGVPDLTEPPPRRVAQGGGGVGNLIHPIQVGHFAQGFSPADGVIGGTEHGAGGAVEEGRLALALDLLPPCRRLGIAGHGAPHDLRRAVRVSGGTARVPGAVFLLGHGRDLVVGRFAVGGGSRRGDRGHGRRRRLDRGCRGCLGRRLRGRAFVGRGGWFGVRVQRRRIAGRVGDVGNDFRSGHSRADGRGHGRQAVADGGVAGARLGLAFQPGLPSAFRRRRDAVHRADHPASQPADRPRHAAIAAVAGDLPEAAPAGPGPEVAPRLLEAAVVGEPELRKQQPQQGGQQQQGGGRGRGGLPPADHDGRDQAQSAQNQLLPLIGDEEAGQQDQRTGEHTDEQARRSGGLASLHGHQRAHDPTPQLGDHRGQDQAQGAEGRGGHHHGDTQAGPPRDQEGGQKADRRAPQDMRPDRVAVLLEHPHDRAGETGQVLGEPFLAHGPAVGDQAEGDTGEQGPDQYPAAYIAFTGRGCGLVRAEAVVEEGHQHEIDHPADDEADHGYRQGFLEVFLQPCPH